MKTLFLNREVYACRTDDGSIFMDLSSGKLYGLDLTATLAVAPCIAGWTSTDTPYVDSEAALGLMSAQVLDGLVSAALLTESAQQGKAAKAPQLRQIESLPFRGNLIPRPRIRTMHLRAFLLAYARTLIDLKFRSLEHVARRIRSRKSAHLKHSPSQAEIINLVLIFRYLRPFAYTAKDHCLLDSLTLIEFLARFAVTPTWLMGVRTRPFGSHSWVLHDGLLLNEQLEAAEEYVPLLAL